MTRQHHPATGPHTESSFEIYLRGFHPDIHEQARDLRVRMDWCRMLAHDHGKDPANAYVIKQARAWRESANVLEDQLVALLYANRLPDPVPGIPPAPARATPKSAARPPQTTHEKARLRVWCDKAVRNLRMLAYAAPREGL